MKNKIKKILVTGSEGNIGKKLVKYLKQCGYKVMRLDIEQKFADDYFKQDIRDPFWINYIPDVVFHLAGMVSRITCEKNPHLAVDVNITGTSNIIQFCKTVNAKLINFSTSEVYGNTNNINFENNKLTPNNMYGITKLLAEKLITYEVKNCGLKAIIIRPYMIYDEDETIGIHRSAMIRFATSLINKEKIIVHKNSKRSWIHIDDVVILLEKSMFINNFEIINIGHKDVLYIKEMATKMCTFLKLNPKKYIIEKELPKKMTLIKQPSLEKQTKLLKYEPKINIDIGILKVLEKLLNQNI